MKKTLYIFLIVLFVLGIGGFLVYQWFEREKDNLKPVLKSSKVQVKSFTRDKTVLEVNMIVLNSVPMGFDINDIKYSIYIDGKEVMQDIYDTTINIKGKDESNIILPITLDNEKFKTRIEELKNVDSVEYEVKGDFIVDLPLVKNKRINFGFKKFLPVIKVPAVKIREIKLLSTNLNEGSLNVRTSIYNPNLFSLTLKNMEFDIMIDDKNTVRGYKKGIIHIPAHSTAELPLIIEIEDMGKALMQILKKGNVNDHKIVMRAHLKSDFELLNNTVLEVSN